MCGSRLKATLPPEDCDEIRYMWRADTSIPASFIWRAISERINVAHSDWSLPPKNDWSIENLILLPSTGLSTCKELFHVMYYILKWNRNWLQTLYQNEIWTMIYLILLLCHNPFFTVPMLLGFPLGSKLVKSPRILTEIQFNAYFSGFLFWLWKNIAWESTHVS